MFLYVKGGLILGSDNYKQFFIEFLMRHLNVMLYLEQFFTVWNCSTQDIQHLWCLATQSPWCSLNTVTKISLYIHSSKNLQDWDYSLGTAGSDNQFVFWININTVKHRKIYRFWSFESCMYWSVELSDRQLHFLFFHLKLFYHCLCFLMQYCNFLSFILICAYCMSLLIFNYENRKHCSQYCEWNLNYFLYLQ